MSGNAAAPPSANDSLTARSPTRARRGTLTTGVAVGIAVVLLVVGLGGGYLIGKNLATSSSG
ncbi:MAG: hypothetical protein AAFA34_02655, partial [Thermoplasmata archaeon]